MIKNAREYQITRAQAVRFERELKTKGDPGADAALAQLEREAARSQLADLRADIEDYDALESGRVKVLEVDDLEDLPQALIRARIAARLSQRELADRLKLKEQQIQRYEATDYASASLARVLEVARALGLKLRQDVALPSMDISREAVVVRLREFGFENKFIESRLLTRADDTSGWRSVNAASRVLGLAPARMLTDAPDFRHAVATAAFKVPANVSEPKLAIYATYARFLAERTLAITPAGGEPLLPDQPREIYAALIERYGGVSLEAVLRYVWALGIPVLPLRDAGAFHGAYWKIGGRGIIVIKQNVVWAARWLIDLLHELYHAVRARNVVDAEILESAESPYDRRDSEEEKTATAWATAAALGERENEIAQMCVDEANGEVPLLQEAVLKVARREAVPADVLANYVAYKLARHDQANWWGAATNLQPGHASPWRVARDIFLEHVELHKLDRLDRELLVRALTEEENSS
jgi:ribosome-binding protein aMBF1 (putative translation factor)